jgi:molecular chaperone GrpE
MTDETAEKPAEEPAEIPVEVAEPEAAAPSPEEIARQRLEGLEKEKKDLHDRLLRSAADFDNFRKRSRKEVEDARAKGREDVLREMLGVVDNLERALAAASAASGPIVDGVKLVLRQFGSALERFEVKGFASVGEAFDPARHEAISQVETADKPAGTVVTELQKGYLMGTRLIRPAMVAVARPPSPPAEATPPAEPTPEATTDEAASSEAKAEG